jgi:phage terminase large subunit-like protein
VSVVPSSRPKLRPFTVEHFKWWAHGLTLDNDEPWEVEDFHVAFVEDVFAGYSVCWLVVPEANAKTTLVAGLALYVIEHRPTAYVPVAASARDQAEWIYRQAEGFVYRSDREDTFKCLEGYRRIRCDGMGSRIQVFAADDRSGDGIIPGGIAVLDELHRHKDLALYRTWIGKLRKRRAQLVVISTAGEVGSEFELERESIRQSATEVTRDGCFVRAAKQIGDRKLSVLHEYAVPEGGDIEDLELVKRANPLSVITVAELAEKRQLPGMTVAHWSRFTCNLASRHVGAAITEAEWHVARTDERIPEGEPVWLGLDLGWKYDTTALVPLWIREPEFRLLGPATILEPPRNGDQLDAHLVEDALLRVHAANPVHTVVMDMTNGAQLSQWIEEQLGAKVVDRTQVNSLACLDYARFMEALRMGWLKHTGDPGLTAHALNAVARVLPQGNVKFERPRESRTVRDELARRRVIDALIAAAMVHTTAAAGLGEIASEPAFAWA